ncbi:MAG: hypothetical protein QNK23_11410 [Crocinitomicaceae bacterium]|nr:hypothetical protein [Crocinitomicaceae bacterium]
MRILILLSLFFMVSCNSDVSEVEAEAENSNTTEEQIATEEITIEEEELEIDSLPENMFSFDDFPKQWIHISDTVGNGEGYVIYHYCDAQVGSVEFVHNEKDSWEINIVYGQDGDQFSLREFKATKQEVELMQVVTGTFTYSNMYNPDEIQTCSFMWNMDEMFCTFNGFGFEFGDQEFVSSENRSQYSDVEEDCEGLWD